MAANVFIYFYERGKKKNFPTFSSASVWEVQKNQPNSCRARLYSDAEISRDFTDPLSGGNSVGRMTGLKLIVLPELA